MPCYHPWKPPANLGLPPHQLLACAWCQGCRLERSRQWAVRCMHEAQQHEDNSYITLTLEEDPPGMSLDHKLFQGFMHRLRAADRRARKKANLKPQKIRYYMCGEYGETFNRPHFHAILFGKNFHDKYPWRKNQNSDQLYRSPELELLWGHGNCEIGAVTFQSAAYVSRYVMKKITGDLAQAHYTYTDQWGEIHNRTPEYNKMSLKPGIAATWLDHYQTDVYPSDQVIANGHPSRPPRYYDKRYSEKNPAQFKELKQKRFLDALERSADNTTERLQAKEKVAAARTSLLKRNIS